MISVIIPVFNQEAYLDKCVNSILNQTCQDYEVIFVNDGSTDNSRQICMKYAQEIDNVSYYEQKNAGVSVARNLGLLYSKGEWIMFVDPDDYLKPDMMQQLLENAEVETDIIACCCEAFDENLTYENHFFDGTMNFETLPEKKELLKQLLNADYKQPQKALTAIGVPWGKIYRKALLKKYGLSFQPRLRRMQDNVFNMYAFWAAKKMKYVDEPLYCYRLENIRRYFGAGYRPFLYRNYITLQDERKIFLEANNLLNDKELIRMFYEDAISQIVDIFNSYILHRENSDSLLVKRRKVYEVLRSEKGCYKEAIKELHLSEMKNKKHAILLLLFKTQSFFLLYAVWKAREVMKKARR